MIIWLKLFSLFSLSILSHRHIVLAFNKVFKETVQRTEGLHWLDFFESLLSAEGGFNQSYELDGTHMNPSYICLIEQALNALPSSQ